MLTKKYSKFNKLLKLNCFRGDLGATKKIKFKIFFYSQFFIYRTSYNFLIFLYKLKKIFKKIIKNKGVLCLLLDKTSNSKAFFNNYSMNFKNFFFDLNPQIFSNQLFLKNLLNTPNNKFLATLKFFQFISFFIIFSKISTQMDKQKIVYILNQGAPFLIFSKSFFLNAYFIDTNFDKTKRNFWFFLVFNLLSDNLNP